jgi:hypothetical protein
VGRIERDARQLPDPMERMVSLHAQLYTAEEIHQLLVVHRSAVGQKYLRNGALTGTGTVVGKQEHLLEVGRFSEAALRESGYESRLTEAPPAPAEGSLTTDSDGRVYRRPRLVAPSR